MIKQAFEYIVGLSKPETVEINGMHFSDRKLQEVTGNRYYPDMLKLSTLSSLVDYITINRDELVLDEHFVHIEGYNKVSLVSSLDEYNARSHVISCEAGTPKFSFNSWMDSERFIIALQSQFCDIGDKAAILKIIGNIKDNQVRTASDDGITQSVTTKKGVITGEAEILPNPVRLAPYRAFVEIDQPVSEFILRMRQGIGGIPDVALFEADGGKWRLEAVARIKEYLTEQLAELRIAILA